MSQHKLKFRTGIRQRIICGMVLVGPTTSTTDISLRILQESSCLIEFIKLIEEKEIKCMPFQAFLILFHIQLYHTRANNTVQELERNVRFYYYNIKITFIFACFKVLVLNTFLSNSNS